MNAEIRVFAKILIDIDAKLIYNENISKSCGK